MSKYVLVDNTGSRAKSSSGEVFTYTTVEMARIAKNLLDERDENFYRIEEA